jgi:hypothetical protein
VAEVKRLLVLVQNEYVLHKGLLPFSPCGGHVSLANVIGQRFRVALL